MAKALKQTLTDIADAIRAKDGTSTLMTSQEMPARIAAIPSGGGGGARTLAEIYPLQFTNVKVTQEKLDKMLKGGGEQLPAVALYEYFSNAKGFNRLPLLPVKNVTNFSRCFYSCSVEVIEGLDTSSSTDCSHMFQFCKIKSIPEGLSLMNTTNCEEMFYFSKLVSFPTMYVGKVTNMLGMFCECSELTSVGSCDVGSVTAFDGRESWQTKIFKNCPKLTHIGFYNIKASLDIDKTAVEGGELKSFLNGLANHEGAKTTLGLNKAQFESLSSADFNALTAKNWEAAQVSV